MKLGKLKPKHNPKTLLMSRYLRADAPLPPPTKTFWEYRVKAWPMLANDALGCCVVASAGHMLENWTAHTGAEIPVTDAEVISAYSAVGGYVPGDESTDQGLAVTDFLQWWQQNGFVGQKISGWAQVDHTDITAVKQAIFLFGACNVGVQLPNLAMTQLEAGETWDVAVDDGGIDGGHCIPIMGWGVKGCTCVTWGQLQYMTWAWFEKYCDEAYGLIAPSWFNADGLAPNTLNMAALTADLATLRA